MAARSWVPGLSEVVCTENGGPLSPDQFSKRQVTATAIRARFGHAKLFDFSIMTDVSTIRCKAAAPVSGGAVFRAFSGRFRSRDSRDIERVCGCPHHGL